MVKQNDDDLRHFNFQFNFFILQNVDKPKTVKNVSKDAFGSKLGRVHMPAQKIGTIQTKKMKGLKETSEEKKVKKAIKIKEKKDKAEEVRKANISAVFTE